MEFRGLMGGLYRLSEWVMRFSATNILWIIGALPVFFFGSVILFSTTEEQLQTGIFLMSVLAPFFLFPSTSAMFALARKWVTGEGDVPIFKTFFRAYKDNYKNSMLGGIILVLLTAVLIFNLRFYTGQSGYLGLLSFLFIALIVIALVAIFNFFCIQVHLHMGAWQVVKNSFLITIGQPIRSIMIAATNAFIVYISFAQITFLIPFFMGSLVAYMTFWHFNNGYQKILERHERAKAAAEEEAAEAEDETEAEDGAEAAGEDNNRKDT